MKTAVDTKHHMIVAHEVTNVGHDRHQLFNMAREAKSAIGVKKLTGVADRGYFKGPEILACEQAGITTYLPKPQAGNFTKGQFGKRDVIYIAKDYEKQRPAGEHLIWRFCVEVHGQTMNKYGSSS